MVRVVVVTQPVVMTVMAREHRHRYRNQQNNDKKLLHARIIGQYRWLVN